MIATIDKIKSIDELKDVLKEGKKNGYLSILKNIDIPFDEFETHFTWNDDHYTRNSIIRSDEYELLVICWESGQESPIHDFDSKSAWIKVIRGRLKEEKYLINDEGELERVSSVSLGVKDFSYISGHVDLHGYVNLNEGRTVSLVFYSQPLVKWNEYDPVTNEFNVRKIGYDS